VGERRIEQEAVVDADHPDKQATGWYHHLEDAIGVRSRGRGSGVRASSPLWACNAVASVVMAGR
jgi:calcium binding protein